MDVGQIGFHNDKEVHTCPIEFGFPSVGCLIIWFSACNMLCIICWSLRNALNRVRSNCSAKRWCCGALKITANWTNEITLCSSEHASWIHNLPRAFWYWLFHTQFAHLLLISEKWSWISLKGMFTLTKYSVLCFAFRAQVKRIRVESRCNEICNRWDLLYACGNVRECA